ncbi:MAG TPA: ABC transporter permease, partial [Burkholderiales bacterium]|nr:ABC transporter permease [Burkholderiales bacterium]
MRDRAVLLAAPAALLVAALFIYPFAYGLVLSFEPLKGDWLANYAQFFSSARLWPTIGITLKLALPA